MRDDYGEERKIKKTQCKAESVETIKKEDEIINHVTNGGL
jgi:hypothetical protein